MSFYKLLKKVDKF
jgi:hypothetical protein